MKNFAREFFVGSTNELAGRVKMETAIKQEATHPHLYYPIYPTYPMYPSYYPLPQRYQHAYPPTAPTQPFPYTLNTKAEK